MTSERKDVILFLFVSLSVSYTHTHTHTHTHTRIRYSKSVRALEGIRRLEASERSLKKIWNQVNSTKNVVGEVKRKKQLVELRDALVAAERCESTEIGLIQEARKYVEETSLEIAANSAFKLMNLETLEILLKEAKSKGFDASYIEMKLVIVRRERTVQEGLIAAMKNENSDEIEKYLNIANSADGIPSWALVDLRKRARVFCQELRKRELETRETERRHKEAERRCAKQANRLLREIREIREGLKQARDAKDDAVLTHWISMANAVTPRLEAFLKKEERLGDRAKCPKDLRNDLEIEKSILHKEQVNAEKLLETFLNAMREERKQQQTTTTSPLCDKWNVGDGGNSSSSGTNRLFGSNGIGDWDAFGRMNRNRPLIDEMDDKSFDKPLLNIRNLTAELRADSVPYRPTRDSDVADSPDTSGMDNGSGNLDSSLFGSSLFGSILQDQN